MNTEKYGSEKTPYLGTFNAMLQKLEEYNYFKTGHFQYHYLRGFTTGTSVQRLEEIS